MFDALYIAATGMHAQQSVIDTISNNLANLNTPGFKKGRVAFDDLLYRDAVQAGNVSGQNTGLMPQGLGTGVADIRKIFADGDLKQTGNQLDVAISGRGFLEVEMTGGERAYTRAGSLRVMAD